jgi:hypothetical protein
LHIDLYIVGAHEVRLEDQTRLVNQVWIGGLGRYWARFCTGGCARWCAERPWAKATADQQVQGIWPHLGQPSR